MVGDGDDLQSSDGGDVVGFGLLHVGLPGGALGLGPGDAGTDGQLCHGDGRHERFDRQHRGLLELVEVLTQSVAIELG